MRLALDYGAAVDAIPFQDVIETWDRDTVQLFLDRGADVVTNAPFARAFKRRIKAILGIFLDCMRARPDLVAAGAPSACSQGWAFQNLWFLVRRDSATEPRILSMHVATFAAKVRVF